MVLAQRLYYWNLSNFGDENMHGLVDSEDFCFAYLYFLEEVE